MFPPTPTGPSRRRASLPTEHVLGRARAVSTRWRVQVQRDLEKNIRNTTLGPRGGRAATHTHSFLASRATRVAWDELPTTSRRIRSACTRGEAYFGAGPSLRACALPACRSPSPSDVSWRSVFVQSALGYFLARSARAG